MRVALVTVTGPGGRRDLAVPTDVPIGVLLDPLARLLGGPTGPHPTGPPWVLQTASGTPLRPQQTLPDAGVTTGMHLQLAHPRPTPPPARTRPPTVAVAGGRIDLPPRHDAARWTGPLRALLAASPAKPTAAEPARWQRAAHAWQTSGYLTRLRTGVTGTDPGGPVTIAVLAPAPRVGVTSIIRLLATTLAACRVGPVLTVGDATGAPPQADIPWGRVLLVDAGASLGTPLAQAAVTYADQVVLVTDPDPTIASHAVRAATPLLAAGRPLTLVVNHPTARPGRLDVARLAELLPTASGPVVVPHAPTATGQLALGKLAGPRRWQRAALELAWLLVGAWTPPDQARPPPPPARPRPQHSAA